MKRILFLLSPFTLLLAMLLLYTHIRQPLAQAAPTASEAVGIPISRTTDGSIKNVTQGIFGPQICTAYGDPFSPINSPWIPDNYTYQYQIRIPADYPEDVVRVELFDPDSVNRDTQGISILVARTANAQNHPAAPALGLDGSEPMICGIDGGSNAQKNPCVLRTGELDLMTASPAYTFDQINPYWLVRVDENRGAGDPALHGDGTCVSGSPASYEPGFNTQTLFELKYHQDNGQGSYISTSLASYTGNTGDGRDVNGFHETDMRWVSPGADKQGFDFPIANTPGVSEVPTNEGSTSFEIDLTTDVPNIVTDPDTGERFLYLDVTTLSGASENVFDIWAGPATYVDTSPSGVNERNLEIANTSGSHDSRGVSVEAIGRLPINNLHTGAIDSPLGNFGPEAAGGTIAVSIFDMDSGAQPPITFFFDAIPESSWALTFSDPGVDDPDGVPDGTRCIIGSCNNQWISPTYQITIPGDLSGCDPLNPTQADCTPFMGGRLMVRTEGGEYDTYGWEISATVPDDVDTTQSCAAFPIAVAHGIRSVTPTGSGSNPYPDAGDFDYPTTPPTYTDFIEHAPDLPLDTATPGTLFKVSRGNISGFDWLVWNTGILESDGSVLSNSLTWPGNSFDYADHGDAGTQAAAGIPHVVRGYVEPDNSIDLTLQVDDWVAGSGYQLPEIAPAVQTLISQQPVLRLIVWDEVIGSGGFGSNGRFRTHQFGLFKLHGYGSSSADDEWLLLEFMGFDTSCGQLPAPTPPVDLAVGNLQIISPVPLHLDERFTAQVTISNTGTTDINSQHFVDLYLNPSQTDPLLQGESVGFTAVANLAAGAQLTVTITTNTNGTGRLLNNQLYAKVDSLDQISESDETNNVTSLTFDVLPNALRQLYLPLITKPLPDAQPNG